MTQNTQVVSPLHQRMIEGMWNRTNWEAIVSILSVHKGVVLSIYLIHHEKLEWLLIKTAFFSWSISTQ